VIHCGGKGITELNVNHQDRLTHVFELCIRRLWVWEMWRAKKLKNEQTWEDRIEIH
jgi:hypothetical protein